MLVDANLLLHAVNADSPLATRAQAWLDEALIGPRRVDIPWQSYWAFLRVATNARVPLRPLTVVGARDTSETGWRHRRPGSPFLAPVTP